jgi:hypothetical protein
LHFRIRNIWTMSQLKQKVEDCTGAIRSHRSMAVRQSNDQKDKQTNNERQNTTQRTQYWTSWTALKSGRKPMGSERISGSCSTSSIHINGAYCIEYIIQIRTTPTTENSIPALCFSFLPSKFREVIYVGWRRQTQNDDNNTHVLWTNWD